MSKHPRLNLTVRYSEDFKLKVVREIESGRLRISDAVSLYDIGGGETVYRWIRAYGKNHLIRKFVRVSMKNETDKITSLEEKIRDLESALAAVTLQNICLQSHVQVLSEDLSEEEKKTLLSRLPKSVAKTQKKQV